MDDEDTPGTREGRLPPLPPDRMVRLKDGSSASARWAIADYELVKQLSQESPELFASALAIARDPAADVPVGHVEELAAAGLLRADTRAMNDDMRHVILSSHTGTPEGAVATSPFMPEDPAQAQYLRELRGRGDERIRKFSEADSDRGEDGPGR